MDRREFLVAAGAVAGASVLAGEPLAAGEGEELYNGIRLSTPWPPRITELPPEPILPPYLKSPPAVIPIDCGRQLFVDDFLIEEMTLRRTFHTPREHAANANVDAASGELTAEVLDERGRVIDGFARCDCAPVRADKTLQQVTWKARRLATLAGKAVKFRFHLQAGRLYAFWVSPEKSGASCGYVAAGGPGFNGLTDAMDRL
jgi:hypothetical protein